MRITETLETYCNKTALLDKSSSTTKLNETIQEIAIQLFQNPPRGGIGGDSGGGLSSGGGSGGGW